MTKDIINKNSKGQYHGCQERWSDNGDLYCKFLAHNNHLSYCEYYCWDNSLITLFYI